MNTSVKKGSPQSNAAPDEWCLMVMDKYNDALYYSLGVYGIGNRGMAEEVAADILQERYQDEDVMPALIPPKVGNEHYADSNQIMEELNEPIRGRVYDANEYEAMWDALFDDPGYGDTSYNAEVAMSIIREKSIPL